MQTSMTSEVAFTSAPSASSSSAARPRLFSSDRTKGINIANWTIETTKEPILSASDSDAAAASLHLPLPEICFGNNKLVIVDSVSGLRIEWNCLDALKAVGKTTEVKVAHAEKWKKAQGSSDVIVQKPYDWTYTSLHPGRTEPTSAKFVQAPKGHVGIPLHLLARQDIPILFFDEVPLFEDELGDNGVAELVVRVRVNSSSLFVLSRLFIRVDHVLFRLYDIRLYHAFGSNEIIRETKGRQATYDQVKDLLPMKDDLTPLTDVNWVGGMLEKLALADGVERIGLDEQRGETGAQDKTRLPRWDGEGVRLEVTKLDELQT